MLLGPLLAMYSVGATVVVSIVFVSWFLLHALTQCVILLLFTENLMSMVLARLSLASSLPRLDVSALHLQLLLGPLDCLKLCWLQVMIWHLVFIRVFAPDVYFVVDRG